MVLRKHPLCVSSTVFPHELPEHHNNAPAPLQALVMLPTRVHLLWQLQVQGNDGGLLDVQHVSSKDAFNASVENAMRQFQVLSDAIDM